MAGFPADRDGPQASHKVQGDPLAVTDRHAQPGRANRLRGAVSVALAVGSAAGAVRTVVRLLKFGKLGPVGLVLAGGQAVLAVASAARAVGRWRATRRPRVMTGP